jgi:ABC-type branched-subunit amino acid transport system substrate-binding protein
VANPDVVVYGGITDEGGGQLKKPLVLAGYHGLLVGGDGVAKDPVFAAQLSASAANGVFAIDPVPDPSQLRTDAATRFIQDFHACYPGEAVDGYEVNAHDAALALIAAISYLIQQGRAVTRDSLLDQVQAIRLEGVTDPIAFDHNGDSAHGTFSIYTLQRGQRVWIKQLSV